jgi:hypothetical protein
MQIPAVIVGILISSNPHQPNEIASYFVLFATYIFVLLGLIVSIRVTYKRMKRTKGANEVASQHSTELSELRINKNDG